MVMIIFAQKTTSTAEATNQPASQTNHFPFRTNYVRKRSQVILGKSAYYEPLIKWLTNETTGMIIIYCVTNVPLLYVCSTYYFEYDPYHDNSNSYAWAYEIDQDLNDEWLKIAKLSIFLNKNLYVCIIKSL